MGGGASAISKSRLSTPWIEDFISHTQGISQVLQSKNIRELMNNVILAMKRVFKVQKVNFLLQCKETVDLVIKEGA